MVSADVHLSSSYSEISLAASQVASLRRENALRLILGLFAVLLGELKNSMENLSLFLLVGKLSRKVAELKE